MNRDSKRFLLATALAVIGAGVGAGAIAGLGEIRSVYMLPMSNGLDQYLASQLTMGSVIQVVTDPLKADVIFTDHLGASFEQQLDELFGTKAQPGDTPDDKGDNSKGYSRSSMQGQRGRGTVFLVDRKSRVVVWSDYEEPKYPTPDGMRRVASRIANKLTQAIKGK